MGKPKDHWITFSSWVQTRKDKKWHRAECSWSIVTKHGLYYRIGKVIGCWIDGIRRTEEEFEYFMLRTHEGPVQPFVRRGEAGIRQKGVNIRRVKDDGVLL